MSFLFAMIFFGLLQPASFGLALCSRDDTLCNAVKKNDIRYVKKRLAAGASVMSENKKGATLLHLAAKYGHTDLIRLCIQQGAEIDRCDSFRRTPLNFAVRAGAVESVELLVHYGANIFHFDSSGKTLGAVLDGKYLEHKDKREQYKEIEAILGNPHQFRPLHKAAVQKNNQAPRTDKSNKGIVNLSPSVFGHSCYKK